MTGTFGSLNIAKTGLQYQQMAIDVADNNISNVSTTGYVRERVDGTELSGPSTATTWSTYPGYGEGVTASGVQRLSDLLLSSRQRSEHGTQSYLEAQQTSMSRFESAIGEPGSDGVSAALSSFAAGLQDLANTPDSAAARQSVLADAGTLTAAFQAQARNVADESAEQRAGVTTDVSQINGYAADIAQLNQSIKLGTASGNDVSSLQDQRDQDALQLAELSGATTTVQADGQYAVSLGGVSLVNGHSASTLAVAGGIDANGAADGSPLTFQLTDPSGATSPVAVTSGDLGGITVQLNVALPQYKASLDAIVSQLADSFNSQHEAGYDAGGTSGTAFFTYDPSDPSGTLAVAMTDPSKVAASSVGGGANLDAGNADSLSTLVGSVSGAYQTLVANLGVQVDALNTQTTNQQAVTTQVDNSWQQAAGVSLDEETVNLMAAQRAYESSAKVLSVMDDVLNTLINGTGIGG